MMAPPGDPRSYPNQVRFTYSPDLLGASGTLPKNWSCINDVDDAVCGAMIVVGDRNCAFHLLL
jgi:hypothetical protein